jgi:hypothetical protein
VEALGQEYERVKLMVRERYFELIMRKVSFHLSYFTKKGSKIHNCLLNLSQDSLTPGVKLS